jgi:hypothetical protein
VSSTPHRFFCQKKRCGVPAFDYVEADGQRQRQCVTGDCKKLCATNQYFISNTELLNIKRVRMKIFINTDLNENQIKKFLMNVHNPLLKTYKVKEKF